MNYEVKYSGGWFHDDREEGGQVLGMIWKSSGGCDHVLDFR